MSRVNDSPTKWLTEWLSFSLMISPTLATMFVLAFPHTGACVGLQSHISLLDPVSLCMKAPPTHVNSPCIPLSPGGTLGVIFSHLVKISGLLCSRETVWTWWKRCWSLGTWVLSAQFAEWPCLHYVTSPLSTQGGFEDHWNTASIFVGWCCNYSNFSSYALVT